ncbi:hypothetical protein DSO57_1006743 [Entomophthora muscae]|uniref:Uncharacterized protein n=1 Tax=Entomophthora muscae TaxID=34485 RepID=A0ACC2UTF8_9FUNG|nr:hypothetical protein DSO57_1006743 [Entomophthora muscae]
MLLMWFLLGVLLAVCGDASPRVEYHVSYLNPDTGEFGGNFTITAPPPWFLRFAFPSPTTQIKHTSGPVEVNHYKDGNHLVTLVPGNTQESVTVNFIATCGVVPAAWEEVLITSPTLYLGRTFSTATPQPKVDFLVEKMPSELPKEPAGIFSRPAQKMGQLKAEELTEPRLNLTASDRASLEADGTYLVGTQLSLIIYSTVFLIGASAYTLGSLLRLKHRKRFRTEKLRRSRTVQGYSQIL